MRRPTKINNRAKKDNNGRVFLLHALCFQCLPCFLPRNGSSLKRVVGDIAAVCARTHKVPPPIPTPVSLHETDRPTDWIRTHPPRLQTRRPPPAAAAAVSGDSNTQESGARTRRAVSEETLG